MTINKKLQMDWAKSLHEAYPGLFPMLDLLMSNYHMGTGGNLGGILWGNLGGKRPLIKTGLEKGWVW